MRLKKREIEYLIEYPLPEMKFDDVLWWMWSLHAFPKWKNQIKFRKIA